MHYVFVTMIRTVTRWMPAASMTVCALAGMLINGASSCRTTDSTQTSTMLKDNAMLLDITPFAARDADGTTLTLRWEEPRDINRIVLTFNGAAPRDGIRVEYKQQHWPDNRITDADLQKGAGGSLGWRARDDWFNGKWKTAKTVNQRSGSQLIITFAPLADAEFPELAASYNVTFRQTNQLRIAPPSGSPTISQTEIYTGTRLQRREIRVEANCRPADPGTSIPEFRWNDARVAVYNGVLEEFRPPTNDDPRARLRVLCSRPAPFSADGTIMTLRTDHDGKDGFGFSFRPDDLDQPPQHIWAPDLGILASPVGVNLRFSDGATTRLLTGKSIYDRINDQPEQSVARALREMPPKRPMHFILGCEARRQKFGVEPNGDLFARAGYVRRVKGTDTPRLLWPGDGFRLKLFWDDMLPAGRSIEAGRLPMLRSRYILRDLDIEQESFATVIGGIGKPIKGEDPVAALMRITYRNRGASDINLAQKLAVQSQGMGVFVGWDSPNSAEYDALKLDDDRISSAGSPELIWAIVREEGGATSGVLALAPDRRSVTWSAILPAGCSRSLVLKMPFIAPDTVGLAQLHAVRFDSEWAAVRRHWLNRIAAGAQMQTGIPDADDFWSAHVTHVMINDEQEPGSSRLIGRVSSFNYGNFSNETIMQVMDLDRRGYHDEARRHLDTFLHYQGTVALPGNYKTRDGVFYGSGGYEQGGYNQHHGWVLWGMAEHYRMTGDREWLLANGERIVKGCDWVLREREATKREDASGRRTLEYGFMPAGSLEDVTDYYYWLSTNALTCRGVLAAAEALTETGHPEGARLLREAREFQSDLRAGFDEQRIRAPLVRLRDGSYVPDYPSRLYHRGRDFGWIREVLEGSINLIGPVIDPNSAQAGWILKDYEDNRYLDAPFNYPLDNLEEQWFSRGGFSFQPNLWYFPPPYLDRDQIGHFLRALFNGFAACWRADLRAMTEHPLPGLDGWAGDHFKSSDESMAAFWLRLMFIQESGDDLYVGRGLPRACLAPGKKTFLKGAATHFGPMSVEIETSPDGCHMIARIDPPARRAPKRMFIRFRHPENARMTAARVNDRSVSFDAAKEWIVLSEFPKSMTVEAIFEAKECESHTQKQPQDRL